MWDGWRPNGPNGLNGTAGAFVPFIADLNNDDLNTKEGNERYHVYVNDHYVGDKECVSQGDGGPSSIQSYLTAKGFEDLNIKTVGDHINVKTDEHDQDEAIKRHLSVYLSIR